MSGAWVAGSTRARALARRRLGAQGARDLARRPTLDDALHALAGTPYGHDVRPGQDLPAAEHAVGDTVLWHLRVLAGWLPRGGVETVRVLAGWFEIANVEELTRRLAGRPSAPPYAQGTLAGAWPRLAGAASAQALREGLAASVWGDPGGTDPATVGVALRVSWAARVSAAVPKARVWAAGGAALLLARQSQVPGWRPAGTIAQRLEGLLGPGAVDAVDLADLADRLGPDAAWVLSSADTADALWRAEASWWARLEHDGFGLLRTSGFDESAVVGAVAVLAADARRTVSALEAAARGGAAREVFDAVA